MKLVSFQSFDGAKLGALINDRILDLQTTYQAAVPDPALPKLLNGMNAFLEGGQRAFEAATHAIRVAEASPEKAVWVKESAPAACSQSEQDIAACWKLCSTYRRRRR